MEFRFNLNEMFQEPIVEIGNSLIPPGFSGDKRALWDTQSKITQIVNAMGEASAAAQGLTKPITTADRLRNSEHKLYLLIDQSANNGKGAVTGMLKTGEKGLYVFDREGQHYQVSPPCVLDFYVHESRQRSGYGKALFEHMLKKQQVEPVKMAVDRPSDKLLGFLNKHYGLHSPVKQMNNYVVYDGFFPKSAETSRTLEADKSFTPGKKQSANGLQHGTPSSPYGRYGAPRPPCSMGQIIHNDSAVIKRNQEPTGVRSEPVTNVQGQQNMTYSNPIPAWQNTQSLPNIPSPQNYVSNESPYPNNPQYAQNQQSPPYQFVQNQNIPCQPMQYPPSSGDYNIQATAQVIGHQMQPNQLPQGQNLETMNQYDQNTNYRLGQGDATNQINKNQNMIDATAQRAEIHNVNQMIHQANMPYHNADPGDHAHQHVAPNNVTQNQAHLFTSEGHTYYYNPQTNQCHIVTDQHNMAPFESQKIPYNNGMSVPAETRHTPLEVREIIPQVQKEPLRPQAFDGTVRKVQQSVSMPITRGIQEKPNIPAIVQETASAPVNYHQHQDMSAQNQQLHHTTMGLNQNHNSASMAQILNPNQPSYQSATVTPSQPQKVEQYQTNSSMMYNNQTISPNPNPPTTSGGHIGLNQPKSIENTTSIPQSFQPNMNQISTPRAPNVNQVSPQPINVNPDMNGQTMMPSQNVKQALPVDQPNHLYQHQTFPGSQQRLPQQQYQNSAPQQNQVLQSPNMSQHGLNQQNVNIMNQNQNANVVGQQPSAPSQNVTQALPVGQQFQHQTYPEHQQRLPQQHYQNLTPQQNQAMQNQNLNQHHLGQQNVNVMNQNQNANAVGQQPSAVMGGAHETNRLIQNVAVASNSVANVESRSNVEQAPSDKTAQNSTPKADRPQSLNIETAVDNLDLKNNGHGVADDDANEGSLDGNHGDQDHEETDSLDGDPAALEAIEQEIEKVHIAPKESTPVSRGSKSPGMEAAGIVTPGRNTPGLTDQGYFDLKFYHNKLW